MAPLSEPKRRDFWEICEDRYHVGSTILTSQLPVSRWHEQVGDSTLADGIPDRLVHNAHRIGMLEDWDAGRFDAKEPVKRELVGAARLRLGRAWSRNGKLEPTRRLTMRKWIASLLMRRQVAGLILFLMVPKIFLNELGRPAFLGYYLGVIATWVAYVIALRHQAPATPAK
jgi:hypothetical protein